MDGPYIGQHGADLTRTACLYEHGGVWMDVGSILIRHLDRVCWDELEDEGTPFRNAIPVIYGVIVANHFVAARRRDPFIYQW
jgi:mannosyltransferase OCH1-like enzyme